MAVRLYDCPSVTIREIDKSQYTPSMSGTKVLVTGFANSGEEYTPMIFTSKNAWLNYYGEPDNEAERYFYAASMEVINQNGVLNCARLPYFNKAREKFVGMKYKVDTSKPLELSSVANFFDDTKNQKFKEEAESKSTVYSNLVIDYFMKNFAITDLVDKDNIKAFLNKAPQDKNGDPDGYRKLGEPFAFNTEDRADGKTEADLKDVESGDFKKVLEVYGNGISLDELNKLVQNSLTKKNVRDIANDIKEKIGKPDTMFYCITEKSGSDQTEIQGDEINGQLRNAYMKGGLSESEAQRQVEPSKTVKKNLTKLKETFSIKKEIDDTKSFSENMRMLGSSIGGKQYKITLLIPRNSTMGDVVAKLENEDTNSLEYNKKYFGDNDNDPNVQYYSLEKTITSTKKPVGITQFKWHRTDSTSQEEEGENTQYSCYIHLLIDYFTDSNGIHHEKDVFDKDMFDRTYNKAKAMEMFEKAQNVSTFRGFDDVEGAEKALEAYLGNIPKIEEDAVNDVLKTLDSHAYMCAEIKQADPSIEQAWKIMSQGNPSLYDMATIDEYRTDEAKVGTNEILIIDKTRKPYGKIPEDNEHKGQDREYIGLIPVITTAANALYAQSMIDVDDMDAWLYEPIAEIRTLDATTLEGLTDKEKNDLNPNYLNSEVASTNVMSRRLNNSLIRENPDEWHDSLSLEAITNFLQISLNEAGGFDRENLKKIGVVVFKAYLDAGAGNKISFQAVEAFCGSLLKGDKNPNTGASVFIDDIINSQSEYIDFFSNCFNAAATKQAYKDVIDILVLPFNKDTEPQEFNAVCASMGFYEKMVEEKINVPESILQALDRVYDKLQDVNERDLDIVVDAGVSNIAQVLKTVYNGTGFYDPTSADVAAWKCAKGDDVKMWKTILQKYDNFCKNVRKDCMFIADGPRPFCLQGQKKIVRPSKPANTIDANILPNLKYLTGVNTNYGAGYCDWFQIADEFSGDFFWCPPSIKASGVYIYTDLNFEYWDAPAGLNRGLISAVDVAFSPTLKQASLIYPKCWNYAVNYPAEGIVLEGQRTLQTKPSALDRVNVRRLLLRLERSVYKTLRYVVYEGNTAYLRQRVVDLINPVFAQAKVGGGVYDYKIVCDESNNTPHTIDNNELHIAIGIKPTKTVEFIMCDFVILSTGASWSEM